MLPNKEQQYEDGYYSAQYVGNHKDLYLVRDKVIPIEICKNYAYVPANPGSFLLSTFKNIQPLELPKPEREVGNYWAKFDEDGDKEIIYYDGEDNFLQHGNAIAFREQDFYWIDNKKIEL